MSVNSIDKTGTMLIRSQYPVWTIFLHPDYLRYKPEIIGKWVHHDNINNLEKIAAELSVLIAEGLTTEIKYRPTPNNPDGLFSHLKPPLCVYSTERNKNRLYTRIYKALKKHGLSGIYWQSNEATEQLHKGLRAII